MQDEKIIRPTDPLFDDLDPNEWKRKNHWRRFSLIFSGKNRDADARKALMKAVDELKSEGKELNLLNFMNHKRSKPPWTEERDIFTLLSVYFPTRMFSCNGWVYKVQPDLAQLLAKTVLTNVKSSMIRMPYPVVFIEIPKEAGLKVYNGATGWHPVEGAYLVEEENTEEYNKLLRVNIVGQSKTHNPFDDASIIYCIPLDNENIEDTVLEASRKLARSCLPSERKPHLDTMPHLFGFLMNVLLYITSADADIIKAFNPDYQKLRNKMLKTKDKKKRRKLSAQLNRTDPGLTRLLGSKIVITGKKPLGETDRKKTGAIEQRRVAVRSWVSGHWQSYWTGPKGKQEKVCKWKKPYLRGPDITDTINRRVHEVKLPRE